MRKKEGFCQWQDVARLSQGREICFFGAGVIAEKTQPKISQKVEKIFDNNPNMWGTEEIGAKVYPPEELQGKQDDLLVVITTTSFEEVSSQLEGLGYKLGVNVLVSPKLNDLRIIGELDSLKKKFLVTSGYQESPDTPLWGGGLYEVEVDGTEWTHRKVYSGTCYGIIRNDDGFMMVDDKAGLVQLDERYNVLKSTELEKGIRAHGLDYHAASKQYLVAATYKDAVLVFDRDHRLKKEIPLSQKRHKMGKQVHHCNDLCVYGESVFVSMFSFTGNFKAEIFDGGVLEFDIESGDKLGAPMKDLWMPHNVCYLNGSLMVCDSLRGELRAYNTQPIGRFPGFTRGLDTDGVYFYVGQSRNRNYSKYLGLSLNISLDTSVIVFDEITKVSRSISLPPQLSEIHSVLAL